MQRISSIWLCENKINDKIIFSMPDLSIVIPTMGNREILLSALTHLREAVKGLAVELILVDDSNQGVMTHSDFPALQCYNPGASEQLLGIVRLF